MMKKIRNFYKSWGLYIFYGILALLQLPDMFNPKTHRGSLIIDGMFFGGYVGGIIVSLFWRGQRSNEKRRNALEDNFRKSRETFERRMWEQQMEARIRARYAGNAQSSSTNYGTNSTNLQEY